MNNCCVRAEILITMSTQASIASSCMMLQGSSKPSFLQQWVGLLWANIPVSAFHLRLPALFPVPQAITHQCLLNFTPKQSNSVLFMRNLQQDGILFCGEAPGTICVLKNKHYLTFHQNGGEYNSGTSIPPLSYFPVLWRTGVSRCNWILGLRIAFALLKSHTAAS